MIPYFDTNLEEILDKSATKAGYTWNLSRKKLFLGLIFSIIKIRNVQFSEIALVLNSEIKTESNLRRIQMFFSDFELDYKTIAIFLMSSIGQKKCRISIDRTNWQFGGKNINYLVLTVHHRGIGVPILFHLLDKKGNSNADERIDLLEEFVSIFGSDCILSVVADRDWAGTPVYWK